MLVVFPACMGIACLAEEIMWIYGGGKYDASVPVLILFAFRTMESAVYTICANQVLYVKHEEKFLVKVLLLGGAINIFLDLLLVSLGQFTPVTAIASTFFAEIVLMLLIFRHIRGLGVNFTFFNRTNIKYVLISLTFIPVTFLVKRLGFGYLANAAIVVPLCVAIYFGSLLLLKDETMLFLSGKILQKLHLKK